jgi:hypothetical protein
VRTEPDTFATLTDLGATVRFHFDERISENVTGGQLRDAITVSPSTGEVRVSHARTALSVQVEGGFRPGIVYRVTLLPVVRDMFGNQLTDPFELVFSTGGETTPNAVAGQVWSRVTGRGASGATVHAVSADSLLYVARADEDGIYTFRYLPEGSYLLTGFDDVDRDGELDARETQGAQSATLAAADTLLIDVPILPTDTTAALAVAGSALDSVTIVLEFDDYLDIDTPLAGVTVDLNREDGGAPLVTRLFHEREYGTYVDQVVDSLARLDSLDAAQAAPAAAPPPTDSSALPPTDSGAVAVPTGTDGAAGGAGGAAGAPAGRPGPAQLTGAQGTGGRGGGGRGGGPPGGGPSRPLPTRRIVGLLDAPLVVDVEYQASVTGVVNINGLTGGRGEVTLVLRPPAPAVEPPLPDSLAPETLPPDTTGAPR